MVWSHHENFVLTRAVILWKPRDKNTISFCITAQCFWNTLLHFFAITAEMGSLHCIITARNFLLFSSVAQNPWGLHHGLIVLREVFIVIIPSLLLRSSEGKKTQPKASCLVKDILCYFLREVSSHERICCHGQHPWSLRAGSRRPSFWHLSEPWCQALHSVDNNNGG